MIRDTPNPDSNIPFNTRITPALTSNYRNTNCDLWLTFYVNYQPTSILCQITYNQEPNHSHDHTQYNHHTLLHHMGSTGVGLVVQLWLQSIEFNVQRYKYMYIYP